MTSHGLLDWPGVVFGWINDVILVVLPEPLGLVFWAVVSGWMTMWVYRRFSNQEKLGELKPKIKAVQNELAGYDGEFSGLKPLIIENFRLSGRQIMLALGPALLAGLPVLFVLVWISNAYGLEMPDPGETVAVEALPAESAATPGLWRWRGIEGESLSDTPGRSVGWTIRWPEESGTLETADGSVVAEIPPAAPTPVLHPKKWWNTLIANPAGYLEADSPARVIELDLPKKQHLPFGPMWMRGWEFLYFVVLIIASISFKIYWRVH